MGNADHLPGRRRFGWYRPTGGATFDLQILHDPLDEATWFEFRELTRVVEWLRPYIVDWLALTADYETLRAAEQEIAADLSDMLLTGMITTLAGVDANAKAQRRLSNFLGAASAFRDRASTRLAGEFGKNSEQRASFVAATRHWFDASFAYRCLYQLRNYAQHHELPVSFVPIQADREPGGLMKARVELQLFPAKLAESDRISGKVRVELRSLPNTPMDAVALATNYMKALRSLMALLIGFYVPRLSDMAHYAAALYRTLEIPHDAVPVVWEGDNPAGGPESQRRAMMMGFDELERAWRLRDELHTDLAKGDGCGRVPP
ncbi:hypothetical protein D9601_16400 [Sphingomonas sp. MA1305]|jgi:hypothetical protein|uniref:hypothetical protein n=1 Tax=Sphingomonas sp. MA1305 TaxID=2479204 RepID=UPI0018E00BE1|nr:hypothetical protein [Sphingomonas sp. MA1305]MBI0476935.1 hypothetical protein [Sphingomonas sp. MA1305]